MTGRTHCCDVMAEYIDPKCPQHPDPRDCEDALIHYDARTDSYALLPRFNAPWNTMIKYCPWCGDPKRDLSKQRFEELDALGFDDYSDPKVPEKYHSDEWWREKDL